MNFLSNFANVFYYFLFLKSIYTLFNLKFWMFIKSDNAHWCRREQRWYPMILKSVGFVETKAEKKKLLIKLSGIEFRHLQHSVEFLNRVLPKVIFLTLYQLESGRHPDFLHARQHRSVIILRGDAVCVTIWTLFHYRFIFQSMCETAERFHGIWIGPVYWENSGRLILSMGFWAHETEWSEK